jgi:hypothetical protein
MKLGLLIVNILVLPPMLYWAMVYIFGVSRGILLCILPVFIVILLLIKFVRDTIKALGIRHLVRSLPKAILAFIPIIFLITPGVGFFLWVESAAYENADRLNKHCEGYITYQAKNIQEKVEKARYDDASVWYNPWTWGDKVKVIWVETTSKTIMEPVVNNAKLANRLTYGSLVSFLDIFVIISRISLCCLIFSSLGYVYSMIVLARQKPIISL